jgi:ribosomal-protein-alanine N-acetyltransferase
MKIYDLNQSHVLAVLAIEQSAHLTPWSEKIIQQSFGKRSHNFGLFKKSKGQDELLGYVFADLVADEMSLENICICSKSQGKGYSKVLMDELVARSRALGATVIWLEVRASNEAAIGLYDKAGFNQVSIRKDYYNLPDSKEKEDAILICLQLQ